MNNTFKIDRRTELSSKSIKSYGSFENIFLNHQINMVRQIIHHILLRHLER